MGGWRGWGPWTQEVGAQGWGPKISRFFFPLPPQNSSVFPLWGPFVEIWWCLKRRGAQMCTFGVLGLSCEAPGGPKPPGFHTGVCHKGGGKKRELGFACVCLRVCVCVCCVALLLVSRFPCGGVGFKVSRDRPSRDHPFRDRPSRTALPQALPLDRPKFRSFFPCSAAKFVLFFPLWVSSR